MTPHVKPRTCLRRTGGFTPWVLLLAVVTATAAEPRGDKVVLWKKNTLPIGTQIRETREIRGENGTRTITGENASATTVRYVERVNMVRRLVGNDRIEVSIRDGVRECVFYLGNMPPPPAESPTPLQGLDLRMRSVSGRWLYELDKGKPTEPQRFALAMLGQYADLLGVLALCITPEPRAKGETWKVNVPRSTGKAYGKAVPEELECRLEDVVEGEGGPQARIAVSGRLKLERPLNLNGSVTVTFAGTIGHRLSDMLDVETSLRGTFLYSGPVMAEGKPGKASIELPWTLTRTQKIEPK